MTVHIWPWIIAFLPRSILLNNVFRVQMIDVKLYQDVKIDVNLFQDETLHDVRYLFKLRPFRRHLQVAHGYQSNPSIRP